MTLQLLNTIAYTFFLHLCSQLAVAGDDYTATSGSLIFEERDLTKSFTLSISSDSVPELDEYIFIAITSVELDPDSVEDIDSSGTHSLPLFYNIVQYILVSPFIELLVHFVASFRMSTCHKYACYCKHASTHRRKWEVSFTQYFIF